MYLLMRFQGPSFVSVPPRQRHENETYSFTEASEPVSQCYLIGVLVVISDSSNRHVPLVGNSANRIHVILHRKVDVTRPRKDSLPALLPALFRSRAKSLHDQVLSVIVPSTSRTKLRENTAVFKQCTSFPVRLVFLTGVVPVLIAEHKVCLAGQRKQRNLVQYCLDPAALDEIFDTADIFFATGVVHGRPGDIDLLGGCKLERRQEL